ncbi:MAG: sulfatase [Solirubrobacterales bacterium]|nr:sulfatase [Solirubrobacterales bacterium]HMT06050.1 sulfatase [Solirubrobacterales bacterium]
MTGKLATGGLLALAIFGLLMMVGGLHEKAWSAPRKQASNFANKPNIVLVQADDLVRGDIRYMPHVRALLQQGGTTFTNHNAPYPLCGPARASLLTGQLAHNNQVLANFKANDGGHYQLESLPGRLNANNTLAPWLKKAGYRTGFVGKYLNDYGALDRTEIPEGWDVWKGLIDQSTYDYYNYAMNINGKVRFWGDRTYAESHLELGTLSATEAPTSFGGLLAYFQQAYQPWNYFGWQRPQDYSMDVNGKMAADFVRGSARSRKPFFLYYATPGPHAEDTNHLQGLRPGAPTPDPRPPKRYENTFDDVPLPTPPSFNEEDVSDKASNVSGLAKMSDATIERVTDSYRGRLGTAKSIDDQVGKIAKALKQRGEFRNTIIILTSDNGYLQGEHRLAASKFMPFENALRIPLLIRGPGIKANRKLTRPSLDVDLTRTVLDAAGAKPGRVMDGISLLGAAKGKKKLPKRDIPMEAERPLFKFTTPLTAFDVPFYGVKTNRYKYIHWSFNEIELYDMKNDPDELQNLASNPAMAGVVAGLEKKALALSECKGSTCR